MWLYLNGQFCGAYMSMARDACLPASVRVASSCLRDIQFSCLLTMAGHPRTSAKPAAMKRPAAYRRLCRVCDLTPAQNGSAYDGMCHRCHSRIAKLKLCVLCGKEAPVPLPHLPQPMPKLPVAIRKMGVGRPVRGRLCGGRRPLTGLPTPVFLIATGNFGIGCGR